MKTWTIVIFLFSAFLSSCSCSEDPKNNKRRKENQTWSYVYRSHDEYLFVPPKPEKNSPPAYPWEDQKNKGI